MSAAQIEDERANFEADAKPLGFDLTRQKIAVPEPWSQYKDIDTGNRWGGWLARAEAASPSEGGGEQPTDEQIMELAYKKLTRWDADTIIFARAALALRPSGEALRHAGAMLSNCAFNLAQRKPGEFTQRDIDALSECRKAWDAAIQSQGGAK